MFLKAGVFWNLLGYLCIPNWHFALLTEHQRLVKDLVNKISSKRDVEKVWLLALVYSSGSVEKFYIHCLPCMIFSCWNSQTLNIS